MTLANIFYEPWHPRGTYRAESQETISRNFVITTGYIYIGLLAAFVPVMLAIDVCPLPFVVSILVSLGALLTIRVTSSYLVPAYLLLAEALITIIALLIAFRELPSVVLFWLPVYVLWAIFLVGKKEGTLLGILALVMVIAVFLSSSELWIEPFHVPQGSATAFVAVTLSLAVGVTIGVCWTIMRFLDALRQEDRRRREFLAILSHELRNPLTPIENSLYILERAKPGGDQALRAGAVIKRQLGQLVSLINDLLDVTRLSHNKIRLNRERLELNGLVRQTLEDHLSLFEKGGVRAELQCAPRPVWVDGDRSRLAQLIANLLQNAAKFTGPGGHTTISVSADEAAKQAVIRVADTGVGMDEETIKGLFKPLMQADKTLDRSKGGLGLGLVLVKGLVDLHQGAIEVHSEGLGKGSEFVVRLPLELSEERLPRREVPKGGKLLRRVLIIEDNVDAANSLRELLELSGHEVIVAFDGPDGVMKAKQHVPEIVLCDVGLPGMSGYDVARTLRADEALKDVRLVAVSGYALPGDLKRASEAGFDEHLAKPLDMAKLEQLVGDSAPNGLRTGA